MPRLSPKPIPERDRIISAARRHFLAHGFRTVTMADLASELGMSKKTLYAHFTGKEALLESVLRNKFASAEAALEPISANGTRGFPQTLHDLLAAMRRETEEVQPAFVRDLQRETPAMFGLVQGFRRELVQKHFGRVLQAGRKAGLIRKDIPLALMVEILIGTTDAIVNPAKMEALGLAVKTAYSTVVNLFLEGALTRNGGKS
jgi:AcrR family transcriptional regulator